MKEVTEFYCHECDGYVRVELDYSLNGNHVITCPECGHEHCRVIENGRVTGDRWSSRNRNTYNYTTTSSNYYNTSMYTSTSTASGTSTATTTSGYSQYRMTTAWANTSGTGSWS